MSKKYNIAIVGATGVVGRETLHILAERSFPIDQIYAIASSNSAGQKVSFGDDRVLDVEPLDNFDFRKVDIVFSSAGAQI